MTDDLETRRKINQAEIAKDMPPVSRQLTTLPMSSNEVQTQVNTIQKVLNRVMKNGTHYGTIPGAGDKPVLFKAGAEKIQMTFRLVGQPVVFDLSREDYAHFRVEYRLNTPDGVFLGAGVGEASGNEEKYKWRKAVCDEEWVEADEPRRRIKWARSKTGPYQVKQVRTNPADGANTVLKMAKKRAQVDAVLTVTAASDVFVQDVEEVDDPAQTDTEGKAAPAVQKPSTDKPVRDKVIKKARAKKATTTQPVDQKAPEDDDFNTGYDKAMEAAEALSSLTQVKKQLTEATTIEQVNEAMSNVPEGTTQVQRVEVMAIAKEKIGSLKK